MKARKKVRKPESARREELAISALSTDAPTVRSPGRFGFPFPFPSPGPAPPPVPVAVPVVLPAASPPAARSPSRTSRTSRASSDPAPFAAS